MIKEFLKEQFRKVFIIIRTIIYIILFLSVGWYVLKFTGNAVSLPSLSWWSASLFSDYKVNSIITEVEAPGYNIRKVQSIDAFGRVCTDTFVTIGMATSCEYPPEERKSWTIEDYRKLAKANK